MRPSTTEAFVRPYHKWIIKHIEEGYTSYWIAEQLGVSRYIFLNYLYAYQRKIGHKIARKRPLHTCLHPEHPIPDTEFNDDAETGENTPQSAKKELSLHGRLYPYPPTWNALSFSQLTALWECATRSSSVELFLLNAAQILFNITIRELQHSKRQVPQFNSGSTYLVFPLDDGEENVYHDVVTFPELYKFIDAVKWLLDKDGTHIESHRTVLPSTLDIAIDRMTAIPSEFEALTFEEFLLIEDLRLSGAPLSQLLSIVYVPTNPPRRGETERRRIPFEARDFKQIERAIKNLINANAYQHASDVWWWWWEGNLRQYAETFPRLFTIKSPEGEVEEAILDKTSILPSRLMYYLAGGDFTKLKDIRHTNIIDAFRLLETYLEENNTDIH